MNAGLTHIPQIVDVPEEEFIRLLGYPGEREVDAKIRTLMEGARSWYRRNGKPWISSRSFATGEIHDGIIEVNDEFRLTSIELANRLQKAGAHEIHVVAVSAGSEVSQEVSRLWEDDRVDEAYFLDAFGSAVVEHLVHSAGQKLCEQSEPQGMAVLPHHSPGYVGWDISDQPNLMNLFLRHQDEPLPGPLNILWSGMLVPVKSLLGVFGITRNIDRVDKYADLVPCHYCNLRNCPYRRAPYTCETTDVDGSRVADAAAGKSNGSGQVIKPVRRNAHAATVEPGGKYVYAFKSHILKKWSDQYLNLECGKNKQTRAVFRMIGNTCSNMGVPIVLDYELTLSWQQDDYLIENGRFRPVEDDRGYQEMCEYIQHGEEFWEQASNYMPLKGRFLDSILEWDPELNPAGCICERKHQNHKWRMVFQTIHFALKGNK
jgi:hypothetical protein